jgi:hypothetical protein
MKIDGVSAILVILIASFAIDRAVTGLLFVLGYLPPWRARFPDPDEVPEPERHAAAVKTAKWMRFVLSAMLAGIVLAWLGKVRLLLAVGFPDVNPIVDGLITTVILVGGSDRVTDILKATGMPQGAATKDAPRQPIEITGTLVLEDSEKRKVGSGSFGIPT